MLIIYNKIKYFQQHTNAVNRNVFSTRECVAKQLATNIDYSVLLSFRLLVFVNSRRIAMLYGVFLCQTMRVRETFRQPNIAIAAAQNWQKITVGRFLRLLAWMDLATFALAVNKTFMKSWLTPKEDTLHFSTLAPRWMCPASRLYLKTLKISILAKTLG